MNVKLKVLHGKLQNRQGKSAGLEVNVRGPNFVIGSDPDCSMRCQSSTINPHHCEIRTERQEVTVRDLYSEVGTFVNDIRVDHEQILQSGDHLRVGRLEFEVLIEEADRQPGRPEGGQSKADPVAEYISDLLVEADEEDRARRLEDPESRQFQPQENSSEATADTKLSSAEKDGEAKKKKRERPQRKPPGKLPPPPPVTADNTVDAAEETLKKIFTKGKR